MEEHSSSLQAPVKKRRTRRKTTPSFLCKICNHSFPSREEKSIHKAENHKSQNSKIKCSLCYKTFAYRYLEGHMRRYHKEQSRVPVGVFQIEENVSNSNEQQEEAVASPPETIEIPFNYTTPPLEEEGTINKESTIEEQQELLKEIDVDAHLSKKAMKLLFNSIIRRINELDEENNILRDAIQKTKDYINKNPSGELKALLPLCEKVAAYLYQEMPTTGGITDLKLQKSSSEQLQSHGIEPSKEHLVVIAAKLKSSVIAAENRIRIDLNKQFGNGIRNGEEPNQTNLRKHALQSLLTFSRAHRSQDFMLTDSWIDRVDALVKSVCRKKDDGTTWFHSNPLKTDKIKNSKEKPETAVKEALTFDLGPRKRKSEVLN